MNDEILTYYRDLKRELFRRNARENLLDFTKYTMANFAPVDFHRHYYQALTDFANGKFRKMMVFVPPQHGKSEGSTRRLPAFLLGQNPDLRIAIVSYSANKARKFNREIQRVIDSEEYHALFPDTCLNGQMAAADSSQSWVRTADECEIVGHRGGFKTVGVGGGLTGDPVDILILDDIYKDPAAAWSATIRENIEDWYDTVADSRLHNESQQLVVFTRWHELDLAGRLLKLQGEHSAENPDGWFVVTYPAIMNRPKSDYDNREIGEALWPERHSVEKLMLTKQRNAHVFESLYQQNPQPAEGLMYEFGFKTWELLPLEKTAVMKNYTDTADTGSDYLCSITYLECSTGNYIVDVVFTQKSMEFTEPAVAQMLCKHNVEVANMESNNGGRGFARNVERIIRERGNMKTRINTFTQSANKTTRIFSHSADVQNMCVMPNGWELRFPDFFGQLTTYQKTGTNAHDDAPDALTGTVEFRPRKSNNNLTMFF